MQKFYSISEAARELGISTKTLRRWDKSGKVKVNRAPNGNRVFTQEDLELLKTKVFPNALIPKSKAANLRIPEDKEPLSPHYKNLFLALFGLVIIFATTTIVLFKYSPLPNQAVLGVETFVAPALEESAPLGSLISMIGGFFKNNPVSSFALTVIQKAEQPLSPDLTVQGKAQIAKDIEGLGNLKIQGTASVGKLVTGIVDPYLIENDGTVQSTLEIKSTGDIKLESGIGGIGNVDLNNSSISNVKNITSTGTLQSSKLTITGDSTIGGTLTTTGGATIGTSLETKKDLTVDGNITLSGVINSNTFTSTSLVFAGSSPSISAGTTNTGISLNSNGTGAISIGNSSKGDIYIGGGSTSTTYCLITNSTGSINCPGTGTFGGSITLSNLTTAGVVLTSSTGALSSAAISGDATLSTSGVLTLANTAVTAGSYGSTTAIPVLTIDSKGRITSASTASISSAWSSITNPTANLSLSMAAYTTTFTYNAATSTSNLFNLTDTTNNTGTGYLMNITTASGSTLKPFHVQTTGSVDAITVIANGETGIGTTAPGAQLQVNPSSTSTIGEIIKAQASQTADLLQIQNSLASVIAKVDSLGNITGNTLTSTVATGTAPLTITSTTMVTNLNSNYVGGLTSAQLTSSGQTIMPNLVLNSAFGRRNRWMTFMPETFADTNSGWTNIFGSYGFTVSGNILTANGTDPDWGVRAGLSTWRDARFSAQFKMIDTTKFYGVHKWTDANNYVNAYWSGGTFALRKIVGGVATGLASVAQAGTLNNWYWIELEAQGTTYIAKLYSSGASPVAKSTATLLQTLSGTISDSAIAAGYIGIESTAISSQWGGLSTGDGGVYVEGWGPESVSATWQGTVGGQAFGFDDTTDSGPIGRQWALRSYIPAASRGIEFDMPDNVTGAGRELAPSTGYTLSMYEKVSGLGGSGALLWGYTREQTSAGAGAAYSTTINDSGETSWTRKSASSTTTASTAQGFVTVGVNYDRNAGATKSATGTLFIDLLQLEQMSSVTPWRNAPADDDPIVWNLAGLSTPGVAFTTTSTSYVEVDSRSLAVNAFLPWDANVTATFAADHTNTGLNSNLLAIRAAGSNMGGSTNQTQEDFDTANKYRQTAYTVGASFSAGKTRFALNASTTAGTMTITNNPAPSLIVTATRGKFDLAEEYSVSDSTIGAGDVVSLSSLGGTTIDRTSKGYQGNILGIVSSDPGITLGNFNLNGNGTISSELNYSQRYSRTNLRPVALKGRVPVKVTNENGSIHRGDTLTSSDKYPGYAMKATKAGPSIGVAMDDFVPIDNGTIQQGLITTFVNLSWYDPDVYLTSTGDFVINKVVSQPTATLISSAASNSPLIATPSATPTSNNNYTLVNTQTKETIDRVGAFNNLFVANLKVGSLDVSNITNDKLKNLELRLKNLELATQSAVLSASISGLLKNEPISSNSAILNSLTVSGKTILNDLGVTGKISQGLLTINGLDSLISTPSATINTISNDLYLQNLGVGGVNFLNGKVLIDKRGNLTVQKLNVSSNSLGKAVLPARQTLIIIQNPSVATDSAVFITPETVIDAPLSVTQRAAGQSFEVQSSKSFPTDVKFDWWIVN